MQKKKLTTTLKVNKVIPEHDVVGKDGMYIIDGKPLDIEMIDQLTSESIVFKKSFLYKMWQGHTRTSIITSIIKDSKNFDDVKSGKAILYALDALDKMMSDIIKQHNKIIKNKE